MISRCPKSEATVEMMPLTCAQALGRQRPATATGVENRMIGCREPALGGHYRGGEWWWQIGSRGGDLSLDASV